MINLELEDLKGAEIVGYSWTGQIDMLQIRTAKGELLQIRPNGQVKDKRYSVQAWLEITTDTIRPRDSKKLL